MATRSIDGTTQSVNITIFDDNTVEDFEFINLRLSTENTDIVIVQQNIATIGISDNDGNYFKLFDSTMLCMCKYIIPHEYLYYHLVAIIDFEQFNYTFSEGSIGSVCVTIVNPVILGMEMSLFPRFFCMFSA